MMRINMTGCMVILFAWAAAPIFSAERTDTATPNTVAAWRVGYAEADITPASSEAMLAGFGQPRQVTGTLAPLRAQALAFEDANGRRGLLFTADVLGFSRSSVEVLRRKIEKAHGIPASAICFSASHTHWGPGINYGMNFAVGPLDVWYLGRLEETILKLAGEAFENLSPGRVEYGACEVRIGMCRRLPDERGEITWAPDPKGSYDPHTPILRITRAQSPKQLVLVGHACHPTSTGTTNKWSPDYPGAMRRKLESALEDSRALFVMGCGGDAKVVFQNQATGKVEFVADPQQSDIAGEKLASDVLAYLKKGELSSLPAELETKLVAGNLSLQEPRTREQIEELAFNGNPRSSSTWWARQSLAYPDNRRSLPYHVQTWRLGDLTVVMLEGEVCADWGPMVRALAKTRHAMVVAYANEVAGYIPTARIIREGGYEGDTSHMAYFLPAPFQPQMEVELTALIDRALARSEVRTGPETEKRFPPLKVPPQFKATLFACDPLIEYPSVLALGPRPNSVFLSHDYMTGLGEKVVRRDEVRLVEDTDGDGYADKSTVWAGGFNSIQGLAQHDGTVFVMHAPFLTVLRDSNGDGVADERHDALSGLGWPPEKAPDRLHGANGVAVGHDGWLYLALGDRGCDVLRPEGDRLVLNGGGILRCRPNGTDLHVFATGLRNIYDIALDEELNVFARDNENDGGTYMIRVCHSFMGADHGYPYLYQEHPDEAVLPMADLGRGSSAGGVTYLEHAFPTSYRGSLFFCEWGRSVVRYERERKGAAFSPTKEIEFAAGAPNDPYGFRPTDVIVDRDGSLLVTDWADGQRPKRGRGRIYRIQYDGERTEPRRGLDSESYLARIEAQTEIERRGREGLANLKLDGMGTLGRLHAVWLFARAGDSNALFEIAERDPEVSVRAQAVRALADLFDPVIVEHKIEAGRGNSEIAKRLSKLAADQDPRIIFEATLALGRLRWAEAPEWLRANIGEPDPTLAHAAQQTLRRSGNWRAVLEWFDPSEPSLRSIALRALANQAEAEVVDGLIRRLETSRDPQHRREYVDLLARVYRKPGPWVYWGFRPAPRPPNTESWERSVAIEKALDRTLADPDHEVRLATLQRLKREKIPTHPETLTRLLREEEKPETVAAILSLLKEAPAETVRNAVDAVARERTQSISNRLAALEILARESGESARPASPPPRSANERHGRLSQLALGDGGNPARGREIYFNAEKFGCAKCHRLGDQGGAIGPDLTGAGRRFPKIHLIESILEPSRAIAPAFKNLSIRTKDGQELAGVRITENESAVTIGDAQGQTHAVKKDQIEELQILELSVMPEGLEAGLTDTEFVDLVAFLTEQK